MFLNGVYLFNYIKCLKLLSILSLHEKNIFKTIKASTLEIKTRKIYNDFVIKKIKGGNFNKGLN